MKYVFVCLYSIFSGQWCMLHVYSCHFHPSAALCLSPPVEFLGQIRVMEERMNLDTDQLPTGLNKNSTKLYEIPLLFCPWERSPIMFIGISVLETVVRKKKEKYGVIILQRCWVSGSICLYVFVVENDICVCFYFICCLMDNGFSNLHT